MIYDKNPPYPHYDHLPYAREPWKTLYVTQRLITTLALVPIWVLYYSIMPRSVRPCESWNLRQIVNVNFTRRIYKVTELAGVTWGTRDPTEAPDEGSLKETRFEWVEPLKKEWRTGIVDDGEPFTKVGCYVWPKDPVPEIRRVRTGLSGAEDANRLDLEAGSDSEKIPLVGIFMHGGGYCHMSAHEACRTSRIPRNLIKRKILQEVYSVEYRLLQHAPFPAVVQDAAAVYAHVVEQYGIKNSKCNVILVGDSSGGNLVLSLARWLRDEAHLPSPDGLLLLSPSCDSSQALPATMTSNIPRPNKRTDYLVDTPGPRALLQRTFLGFTYHPGPNDADEERRLMEIVHSEYVSPCSPIVLKRWGHEAIQDPEPEHERHFIRNVFKRLRNHASSALDAAAVIPTNGTAKGSEGPSAVLPLVVESKLKPTNLALPAGNANASASFQQISASTSTAGSTSTLAPDGDHGHHYNSSTKTLPSHLNPYKASSRFPTLFAEFPRSLIVCGDAERLVREVRSLIGAMSKDGVDLEVCWARDACHDILMLSQWWWHRAVMEEVWESIRKWAEGFERVQVKRSGENAY